MNAVWIVRCYRADRDDVVAVFDMEDAATAYTRQMVIDAATRFSGSTMTFEDAEFWVSENDDRTGGWGVGIEQHIVQQTADCHQGGLS